MKNALNNQVGMLGDMFLWLVANLKQGVIYFIKQALPPNISAGSVSILLFLAHCSLSGQLGLLKVKLSNRLHSVVISTILRIFFYVCF